MVLAWHMGALHPIEQALTLLLAFGPFVLLGIVVAVRRRTDGSLDEQDQQDGASGSADGRSEPAQPTR